MNQSSKADDFAGVVGSYRIDLKEKGHAAAVGMVVGFGILWLYLNEEPRHLSLKEGIIATAGSLFAVWYVLHRALRTVVVDRELIVSTGPFGALRQEVRINDIRSIRFGGFTRGIDVDFDVGGKVIRLKANRRFHRRMLEEMDKVAISEKDPIRIKKAAQPGATDNPDDAQHVRED